MKLAIQLSGQPRQIGVGYTSLKKFYLDRYDCDVFCHTWFDDPLSTKVYGDLIALYNPKKILIEKQITFDDKEIKDAQWGTTLQNLASMWYSIGMANSLRNTDVEYDFVMRMRTDLQINRPIELEKIEKDKLALYKWTVTGYDDIGLSDVFGISSPNIMDVYSDLYNSLTECSRPEYVLKNHIVKNNIPVQYFYHDDVNDPSWNLIR